MLQYEIKNEKERENRVQESFPFKTIKNTILLINYAPV